MKLNRLSFIVFVIIFMATSCVVTKKKYQALEASKKKSIDSLNKIVKNTRDDFNSQKNQLVANNAYKNFLMDSLLNEIKRLSSDTLHLKQSLKDAINDFNIEKNKLKNLSVDFEKKTKIADSLSSVLYEKEKRLSELEKMIDNNKAEVDKLKSIISLALNSFDASELTVYQKDGKVYVAMEEKLLFKSGSAKVDKKGEEAIKKLAEILEKNTSIDILIEGHTDNVGSPDFNWKLSSDRALSIVSIMQANSKIDPKRYTAAGRGMYSPVANNDSNIGKQKNRRIDIILIPKLDQLYKMLNEQK